MTLTIELPDEAADRVRAAAEMNGQDVGTFAVAAVIAAADSDIGDDEYVDPEVVAAGLEAIEDARAGRLLTLEDVGANIEAALSTARRNRSAASSSAHPEPTAAP